MSKKHDPDADRREELLEKLADNLTEQVTSVFYTPCDKETENKIRTDISERINFEASVAVNEAVTKYVPARVRTEEELKIEERTFVRFGRNFRAQHMLMIISVVTLIITGMPLKFPEYALSKFIIIDLLGGLQISTLIHRIGAVGLIIVALWHLLYTFFSRVGWRDFILMIPRPSDVKDAFNTVLFYLGKRNSGVRFGRFSFIEKFDYWAVYWGMIIMICSGSIMWYKELFSKELFDIAREAHSDEGLLATLAIIIWHFYNVHFNPEVFPMSWVWWHGKLTETEIKHHHPLEYAEIMETESKELTKQAKEISEDKESSL